MKSNARAAATLFALVTATAEAALQAAWIAADRNPGASVCCGFVGPVLQLARAGLTETPTPFPGAEGLLAQLAARAWAIAGGHADFTGWTLLFAMLAAQVFAFLLGGRLGGPWAGALAAALLPLVPGLAFFERRWDVYGLQVPVVLAGAWLTVEARGMSRPLPAAAFGLLGAAASRSSPRATDNLLVLLALFAMAAAGSARALALGRGPSGDPVSRLRSAAGTAIVGVGGAALAYATFESDSPEGLRYYASQAVAGDGAPGAYLGHLFWRALTPWLAVPLELALVAFALRGRGRAELLTWIALPLAILSTLPKKNFYYAAPIYPALPVVIALGIAALPWRSARAAGFAAVLGLAALETVARTFPGSVPALAGVRWQRGDPRYGGAMQTSDRDLALAPHPDEGTAAAAALAAEALGTAGCGCRVVVLTAGLLSPDSFALYLAERRPCAIHRHAPPPGDLGEVGVVVVEGAEGDGAAIPGVEAFAPYGSVGQFEVFRRPDGWFGGWCREGGVSGP